jgi:hypothetical protein
MSARTRLPETAILPISQGDTITVKKHLTTGEFRAFARATYTLDKAGTQVEANPIDIALAKILTYLLDWTVTDYAGQPLVIWRQPEATIIAALNLIDPECYAEILQAITTHDVAMRDVRTEKKTDPAGAPTPSSSSASPSGPA